MSQHYLVVSPTGDIYSVSSDLAILAFLDISTDFLQESGESS